MTFCPDCRKRIIDNRRSCPRCYCPLMSPMQREGLLQVSKDLRFAARNNHFRYLDAAALWLLELYTIVNGRNYLRKRCK